MMATARRHDDMSVATQATASEDAYDRRRTGGEARRDACWTQPSSSWAMRGEKQRAGSPGC
ncbi:hypothetical protein BD626DRAFT_488455 [Schizophyllum amplum]|uniref:Uncharacterized protein n=1 Tax=Schizophyllum amplum TaxID=97359 RepID=A0A550CKK5_9AGAR|nr:hypothetical protein BD626DRAFT_488455 [Auriculariopsis ampla]